MFYNKIEELIDYMRYDATPSQVALSVLVIIALQVIASAPIAAMIYAIVYTSGISAFDIIIMIRQVLSM